MAHFLSANLSFNATLGSQIELIKSVLAKGLEALQKRRQNPIDDEDPDVVFPPESEVNKHE